MQGFDLTSEMLAALVGIGIALVAQVLVHVFSSFDETKKWKRQQMIQAYRECLAALGKLENDVRMLIQFRNDPNSNFEIMTDNCQESLEACNLAISTVQITASDRFGEKVNKYSIAISTCVAEVFRDKNHGWTLERFQDVHSNLWLQMRDQAQRDLGLRHWWDRRPKDN